MTYAIIHGNPISGLRLVGPFADWAACQDYIGRSDFGSDVWLAELEAPGPDLERYQQQWVDTREGRILDFDECGILGLDGTLRRP
jgi:hypothetical protein